MVISVCRHKPMPYHTNAIPYCTSLLTSNLLNFSSGFALYSNGGIERERERERERYVRVCSGAQREHYRRE